MCLSSVFRKHVLFIAFWCLLFFFLIVAHFLLNYVHARNEAREDSRRTFSTLCRAREVFLGCCGVLFLPVDHLKFLLCILDRFVWLSNLSSIFVFHIYFHNVLFLEFCFLFPFASYFCNDLWLFCRFAVVASLLMVSTSSYRDSSFHSRSYLPPSSIFCPN